MCLCSMSTSLPSDLSSRGRQGSTVSDNTTGVTPIVDNVQLSLPAPSPVCDAIEDDESNDGASSVDKDLDEYYLVNEVSPAAADAQDACALVEIKEQNHDPKDSAAAMTPLATKTVCLLLLGFHSEPSKHHVKSSLSLQGEGLIKPV